MARRNIANEQLRLSAGGEYTGLAVLTTECPCCWSKVLFVCPCRVDDASGTYNPNPRAAQVERGTPICQSYTSRKHQHRPSHISSIPTKKRSLDTGGVHLPFHPRAIKILAFRSTLSHRAHTPKHPSYQSRALQCTLRQHEPKTLTINILILPSLSPKRDIHAVLDLLVQVPKIEGYHRRSLLVCKDNCSSATTDETDHERN